MATTASASPPVEGITHHTAAVNGTTLHYVSAGTSGPPILLVHGFPETWWAFHKLIPLLAAASHRVFAVDLRGFGDSAPAESSTHTSAAAAEDLRQLIAHHLDVGPVHLLAQDISGGAAFRLAAAHPQHVRSFGAVEMGLAGFGLEALADVTHGGAWHIGVLAAPNIPELLLAGRERAFLAGAAFPSMTAVAGSITDVDYDEFARTYSRPGAWRGAAALYRSMLAEGDEIRVLAASTPLALPVLAVGAGGGPFTEMTMRQVTAGGKVTARQLDGVGHYAALEAPERLAEVFLEFVRGVESA
ncbi:alpha/beta hydrolase fold protein [Lasiosphaeria ovina]|uniref:Alpha/beta hydrolase fold protein n=1 Tax=Lasiosphaeria ovina TaxID=92902 RepID=A0AAE0N8F6_9PEZI|nr:alpha/beta hydrolase fold protein [Lasiosphaeria ovina]